MVWWRNGIGLRLVASGLIGLACAAGCGGESSTDKDEGGEGGDGATGGTRATGGSSATGGSGGSGGKSTGGSSATGGSGGRPNGPRSDLYFYRFYAEDAVGADEQDGTYVEFAIANQGEIDAPQPHQFSIVLSTNEELGDDDDIEIYSLVIDQVIPPPDQLSTPGIALDGFVAIDEEIPDGFYYVGGIIDVDDEVEESNEDNNAQLSNRIFVGVEDFGVVATAITPTDDSAAAGDDLEVAVQVRANGNQSIEAVDFDIVLSEDDEDDEDDVVICSGTTDSLEVAEEILATATCRIPRVRGYYYLGVRLDPDDTLRESDEDDNVRFSDEPISITSPDVDLAVAGFTGVDLELDWQGDLDLSVQVQNLGEDDSGTAQVAMYLSEDDELDEDDLEICARSVPAVEAGGEVDVLIQCHLPTAAAGELRLLAFADSADALFETDEDNNVGVAPDTITVGSPDFDLVYTLHNVTTAAALTPGAMFGMTVQAQNPGRDTIPGFELEVYFSTDDTITRDDELACDDRVVDPIPGSTVANFTFSCQVPEDLDPGSYYLGVILDPNGLLPETSEGNNRGVDDSPRTIIAN